MAFTEKKMEIPLICIVLLSIGFCVEGSLLGKFVQNKPPSDESALSILNKPTSVMFTRDPKPLPSTEITSILSLALGFSTPKEIEWRGLLSGNPFSRPDAVVLFTVDSVQKGVDLNIHASERFPVKVSEEDASRTEMLSLSHQKTLSSHLSDIYDGKSYTLSISADEDLAAAGYSDGEKSQTVVWNKKENSWVMLDSKSPKGEVIYTKEQLLNEIDSIFNKDGIRYNAKKEQLVVKVKTAEVHFDSKSEADFLFFSELAVTKILLNKVAVKHDVVGDRIPDVFMIGFSSLKELQRTYGLNSPQVKAAILILEKIIPELTEKLVNAYNGNILAAQLTLKTSNQDAVSESGEHKGIYDKVKTHLGQNGIEDFYIRFQELHVANEIENHARQSLCKQMASLVSGFGGNMNFKCANEDDNRRLTRRSLLAKMVSGDQNTIQLASLYNKNFPVIFNLWFWLMVVLFLSVYAISLVMWYMDPGRDSIIYRMTSQRVKND